MNPLKFVNVTVNPTGSVDCFRFKLFKRPILTTVRRSLLNFSTSLWNGIGWPEMNENEWKAKDVHLKSIQIEYILFICYLSIFLWQFLLDVLFYWNDIWLQYYRQLMAVQCCFFIVYCWCTWKLFRMRHFSRKKRTFLGCTKTKDKNIE